MLTAAVLTVLATALLATVALARAYLSSDSVVGQLLGGFCFVWMAEAVWDMAGHVVAGLLSAAAE